MQAILLAAGESSRFWPLSDGIHKSLSRVMGKPLIHWTIEAITRAGIKEKDIIIVQNMSERVEQELGTSNHRTSIKYAVQAEPRGMGNAMLRAESAISGPFVLLNPYHIDADVFIKELEAKSKKTGAELVLLGKKTDTPQNYGILELKGDQVLEVVEKPARGKEPSDIRVIGIYLLPREFLKYYTDRESNYSFEAAISHYATKNDVRVAVSERDVGTLKYPWNLFGFAKQAMAGIKLKIAKSAKVDKSAKIGGDVYIGNNARILENAVIKGPAYIGDGAVVGNNALIRESDIEAGVIVGANAEVARSIICAGTHIHSGYIGDSIIAENCRIGAGFITGNVRIDRGEISSVVRGEKVKTGMKSFGAVIGRNTKIGIGVKTMPGVLIGANCAIGPGTVVNENVESNTTYYSEFKGVVKKKGGMLNENDKGNTI